VPLYLGCWVTQIPNRCLVVSDGPWWSSTDTVAFTPCDVRCILSCASFSFRVPSSSQPHERSRVRAPPLGFASLMTTSTRGVHNSPGIPRPTMFRPQRFARSRRLTPPRALRACFIALPCPGFSLQGLLPPSEPHHLVGGRYPRAVGVARLPVTRRQRTSRRPQGLALVQSPLCPRRRLSLRVTRVPSCFSCSRGHSPETLEVPSHSLRSRPWRSGAACAPYR